MLFQFTQFDFIKNIDEYSENNNVDLLFKANFINITFQKKISEYNQVNFTKKKVCIIKKYNTYCNYYYYFIFFLYSAVTI